jgi:broad specificity phosphatase PhoE
MSIIYLVRHGQASFGKADYDVLSETGELQSRFLGQHFIKSGKKFDAVYSGSMTRQLRTAQIMLDEFLLNNIEIPVIEVMPEFNEYDSKSIFTAIAPELLRESPGLEKDYEKIFTDRRVFQKIFELTMLRWIEKGDNVEAIESWNSVKTRVSLAVSKIAAAHGSGSSILVVASGGTISACIQDVTGISDEMAQRLCWQTANTSVSSLVYNASRITLKSFNALPHLEILDKSLVTYR